VSNYINHVTSVVTIKPVIDPSTVPLQASSAHAESLSRWVAFAARSDLALLNPALSTLTPPLVPIPGLSNHTQLVT